MLNRKTPDTLAANIKLEGNGETSTEAVEFHFRTEAEVKARTAELEKEAAGNQELVNTQLTCFIVKSINGHEATPDAVSNMEARWPGTCLALYLEFHRIRRVELAKN